MTDDRQELTIAGVTILVHQQSEETRQIAEVIPAARSAGNGERPRSFAPPEATLVSDATGPDPFALPPDAERRIGRLLPALPLLSGATTAGICQVTGETIPGFFSRTLNRNRAGSHDLRRPPRSRPPGRGGHGRGHLSLAWLTTTLSRRQKDPPGITRAGGVSRPAGTSTPLSWTPSPPKA